MFESIRLVKRQQPQCVVVGVFNDRKPDAVIRSMDAGGEIAAALGRPECTGETGKIAEAFPRGGRGGEKGGGGGGPGRVIVVGLGKREGFKPGTLRAVGAAVGRRLAVTKDERVHIALDGVLSGVAKLDLEHAGRCLGEGLGLIGWRNWNFKGKGSAEQPRRTDLSVSVEGEELAEGVDLGMALAESTNFCRDLSEAPPNVATTGFIAQQAQKLARHVGLKCTVFQGEALEREGFVGLINVGKASEHKPCLVRLEYTPPGGSRKGARPAVIVGKTMTYDTGGLSLKVNNGMVGMKRDKDGGCAVLGAMHAVATVVRPGRPVVALLAVAENSISDEAYRPDDVLRYRNGVTVEVTNTDAEGRLVLADALIWACEKERPAYIVDLATLTGGVVTALGSTFAGLFCEDEALRERLARAMETSGERWWRLPMDQEYRDMMKSPVADIVNSNPNRKAHPIQGAAFLSYFVDPKVPWAHLDIAGVHVSDSDSGPFVKGPTGWGVRLLADLLAE
jgi:leucyl aminopeptidase